MPIHPIHRTAGVAAAIIGLTIVLAACGGEEATPTPEPATPASAGTAALTTEDAAGNLTAASAGAGGDGVATPIRFDEFYTRASIREGLQLSDKLQSLDGRRVVMQGYMAPPLKPELDFFVLTKVRLAYCPFCSTAAEWPDDIAVVYTPSPMKATDRPVAVEGTIEIGSKVDPETGMLSLVRIYADAVDKL